MTTDEIIDLAQEAGFRITFDWEGRPYATFIRDDGELYLRRADALIRFASLVRAQTLEEAAGVCIETGCTKGACDAAFDIADACAAAIRAMKENVND